MDASGKVQPEVTQDASFKSYSPEKVRKNLLLSVAILLFLTLFIMAYSFLPKGSETQESTKVNTNPEVFIRHYIVFTQKEILILASGKKVPVVKSIMLFYPDSVEKKTIFSAPKNFSYHLENVSNNGKYLLMREDLIDSSPSAEDAFIPKRKVLLDITNGSVTNAPGLPENFKVIYSTSLANKESLFISDEKDTIKLYKYNRLTNKALLQNTVAKKNIMGISAWKNISLSPDNTKISYSDGTHLYILDLMTGRSKQLSGNTENTSPAWFDTSTLIFPKKNSTSDSIWLWNIASSSARMVIGPKIASSPFTYAFAASGNKIIYPGILDKWGRDILLYNVSTNSTITLYDIPSHDFSNAQVSKDYNYLVFSSFISKNSGIGIYSYDIKMNKQTIACLPAGKSLCGEFLLH